MALVYLLVGDAWECYEVPDVIVLPRCSQVLYSTRDMRDLFGFAHDLEGLTIAPPGASNITIRAAEEGGRAEGRRDSREACKHSDGLAALTGHESGRPPHWSPHTSRALYELVRGVRRHPCRLGSARRERKPKLPACSRDG